MIQMGCCCLLSMIRDSLHLRYILPRTCHYIAPTSAQSMSMVALRACMALLPEHCIG